MPGPRCIGELTYARRHALFVDLVWLLIREIYIGTGRNLFLEFAFA